jgi:hypothetical protein
MIKFFVLRIGEINLIKFYFDRHAVIQIMHCSRTLAFLLYCKYILKQKAESKQFLHWADVR